MSNKLDEADVTRILDNLVAQGNGEEVSNWCLLHICSNCGYMNGVFKV